ncbi:MAG: DUF2167 domain-containing protein [Steroidobacteraceae bacterium]
MSCKDVRHWVVALCTLMLALPPLVPAQEAAETEPSAAQKAFMAKLDELKWVKGPTTVEAPGDSKLTIPEGYVFLDRGETDKFLELNQNPSNGTEVMVAPESLDWSAYINFSDEGYVKDDETIDAPALLKSLQEGTKAGNAERRRRGWDELEVTGWAVEPAYNPSTKRLEWATRLRSRSGEGVNFFTKILGRKGHTTVVLVAAPQELRSAESDLNRVLTGYNFNQGHAYADFVPGDKVAQYGLAALVLGGAAAVASKKGLWAVLGGFIGAAWKFLLAGAIAAIAGLRRLLGKKDA